MWWFFTLEFVLLGVVIAFTLRHYASKEAAWHVFATVWFSWTVALAIVWIVPLDLFSVYKTRCEDSFALSNNITQTAVTSTSSNTEDLSDNSSSNNATSNCPKVLLNDLNQNLVDYMWKVVYWSCQLFGWVILTMQQSLVDAGQFTFRGRFYQALKENLIIIAVGGVLVVGFVIYLSTVHGMNFDNVLAVLMAVTNCVGLLCVILLLSYGLVELPRAIWRRAFLDKMLMRAEFDVVTAANSLDDAKVELAACLGEVRSASNAVRSGAPTFPYVERIIRECPHDINFSYHRREDEGDLRDDPDPLAHSMSRLIILRRRLKRAVVRYRKSKSKWDSALERGFLLQDIVKARNEKSWCVNSDLKAGRTGRYAQQRNSLEYLWLVYLKPIGTALLSVVCWLLSLALLTSEVSLLPSIASKAGDFWGRSPISWIIRNFGNDDLSVLILVFIPLAYICVSVYFSLFRMKIFNIYEVVPDETDDVSLLFTGYFITRLVPAICYNFLNLLGETHETLDPEDKTAKTVFELNFKAMGTVPLLGGSYNNWLPPIIIVFSFLTFANVGAKCLRLCNVNRFEFEDTFTDDQVLDGRVLLNDERRHRLRPENGMGRNMPAPNKLFIKRQLFPKLKAMINSWRGKPTETDNADNAVWGRKWERLEEEINQI